MLLVSLLHFLVLVGALRRVHKMKHLPTGLFFRQDHNVQGLGLKLVPFLALKGVLLGRSPKEFVLRAQKIPDWFAVFCQVRNKLS